VIERIPPATELLTPRRDVETLVIDRLPLASE
jgi:hypothetical protein